MRNSVLLVLGMAILVTCSCHQGSKYPGFKKGKHGIYYQLHTLGEDTVRANPGDYITVNLNYTTLRDSVFFKGTRKLQLNPAGYQGSVDECFQMLASGESATFILAADPFFSKTLQTELPRFMPPGSYFKIYIEMLEIQTQAEYQKEKEAFLSWIEDFGDYEKVILRQFIAEKKLSLDPLPSGLLYLNLTPGTGSKVELGDTVTVHYEGRFLNGRFFDSTVKRNQPFQFVYGTEWQVITGLEEAIGIMREGERSLFILPSEMGFGNEGSSTGIVPPFTSLIFEVELLKVSSSRKI